MCWSAIPGQNEGIRAIRDIERPVRPIKVSPEKQKKERPVHSHPRRHHGTVCIASGEREPISWNRIQYACCRREHRWDETRGKRLAKRQHKPEWRSYEKY